MKWEPAGRRWTGRPVSARLDENLVRYHFGSGVNGALRSLQMIDSTSTRRIGRTAAWIAGVLLALSSAAFATEQAQQRREGRDTKQDAKQEARQDKAACKQTDGKSNAECRQVKRDAKQDGRQEKRDIKRQ